MPKKLLKNLIPVAAGAAIGAWAMQLIFANSFYLALVIMFYVRA